MLKQMFVSRKTVGESSESGVCSGCREQESGEVAPRVFGRGWLSPRTKKNRLLPPGGTAGDISRSTALFSSQCGRAGPADYFSEDSVAPVVEPAWSSAAAAGFTPPVGPVEGGPFVGRVLGLPPAGGAEGAGAQPTTVNTTAPRVARATERIVFSDMSCSFTAGEKARVPWQRDTGVMRETRDLFPRRLRGCQLSSSRIVTPPSRSFQLPAGRTGVSARSPTTVVQGRTHHRATRPCRT